MALWKWLNVGRNIQLVQLARMSKPSDATEASVWRWTRAAWWAWLFVLVFLTATLIAGVLGLI